MSLERFGWFALCLYAFKCTGVRFTFGSVDSVLSVDVFVLSEWRQNFSLSLLGVFIHVQ